MKVKNLSFSYNQKSFIKDLNIEFKENQITTIIGSNGSGKSTLLMLLSRIYKPQTGFIEINQQDIQNYKIKEFAQKVAVVHQKNQINGDQDVKTIVGYGRLPYLHYSQKLSQEDYEIIDWALEVTNLKDYKNRTLKKLSGGQQQRVWIAMALAQKTPYLLLDEPTTYLDIRYQLELLRLLKEINQKYKITIIMVLHDINQAIQYSDNIIAIKKGRIIIEDMVSDNCQNSQQQPGQDPEQSFYPHSNIIYLSVGIPYFSNRRYKAARLIPNADATCERFPSCVSKA